MRECQLSPAAAVFGEPGYSVDLALTSGELDSFRSEVEQQWLRRIGAAHPEHVGAAEEIGLAGYHRLKDLLDHVALWGSKEHRILSPDAVERLLSLPLLERLRGEFGSFVVADVVHGSTIERGRPEIYWRLVRPERPEDVGGIHADHWFHDSFAGGTGMFPSGTRTAKIWIPLYCEPGLNGLAVVPRSHHRTWAWHDTGDGRPQLTEPLAEPTLLLDTEPGRLAIFHDHLLHAGVPNRGSSTRVSVELTLVLLDT